MASLADFDDTVLAIIISQLSLFDRVSLRETCTRTRALIPAPRKRTPQKQWRWAMRRDEPQIAHEAILAGARDLQRYARGAATLDECRAVWTAKFACVNLVTNGYGDYARDEVQVARRLEMTRAIIRCDIGTFMAFARDDILRGSMLDCPATRRRVGRYLPDDTIHAIIFDFKKARGFDIHGIASAVADIAYGALRHGRSQLAIQCARIYDGIDIMRNFILSGNVQACRELQLKISANAGLAMDSAAASGNPEMCAYVGECIIGADSPFMFGRMVAAAAAAGHLPIIDLALKWADECARDDALDFFVSGVPMQQYVFRADGILEVMKHSLSYLTHNAGSSAMFAALLDRCRERAIRARSIDYERAVQLLKQPTQIALRCITRLKRHREAFKGPYPSPNYAHLFESAARAGAYWLADMIYELAEKDDRLCEINIDRIMCESDFHTSRDIITILLRGRYMREMCEMREHMQ